MWDWRNYKTGHEARTQLGAGRTELKVTMDEERIRLIIDSRSTLEKSKLFVRRTTTQLVNAFILLVGWAGIILISIYDKKIQEKLRAISWAASFATLVPSVSLSIINSVIPIVSKKITEYEAWDF
jgi:hypothetical protein